MIDRRKILVFGSTGQLAREIARIAPDAIFAGRDSADLMRPSDCAALVDSSGAKAVLNAAAWTAVDEAENHPRDAYTVNAEAPGAMAEAAKRAGLPFIHISTDYVFDGSGSEPFLPSDATGPLGVYGASKLEGEEAVRAAGGAHAILRTSWIFSAHGKNFVKTILSLSETRDSLTIVADQVGGPTPAAALAAASLSAADHLADSPEAAGTYHFAGSPDVSWAEFARAILAGAGRSVDVVGIPTADYPTLAPRPLNSRLDCTSFEAEFGLRRPNWRVGLAEVLKDLCVEPHRAR